MSTFTPTVDTGQAGVVDDREPSWKQRLFAGSFSRARNVWIVDGTTVQEYPPTASYNSDGSLNQLPEARVTRWFQGAQTHTVNASESTLLTAAGYTVVG